KREQRLPGPKCVRGPGPARPGGEALQGVRGGGAAFPEDTAVPLVTYLFDHLELEQRGAGGDGVRVAGVRAALGRPGLERFLGFPFGDDEVALLALDRPQQLETDEAG